jgi:uncharacterized protein YndB with AHSA1/START domain
MDMSSVREPPAASTANAPGTVEVRVALPVAVARAWEALTEPEVVSRWFGELSPGLRQGGTARLDFGDGDFFAISNIKLATPQSVDYDWRFLGTGPVDHVRWRVAPKSGGGCSVTVTDTEPFRSPEATAMLREGWLDFTSRLVGFLTTGRRTRYDWRRELDGYAELPCSAADAQALLADAGAQADWLPFGGVTLSEGASFTTPDELPPRTFVMRNLRRESAAATSFQITCDGWLGPTECRLDLTPHGGSALLGFSHTGWESISRDPDEQLSQRRRFCGLWVEALERARTLAGRDGDGFHARDT